MNARGTSGWTGLNFTTALSDVNLPPPSRMSSEFVTINTATSFGASESVVGQTACRLDTSVKRAGRLTYFHIFFPVVAHMGFSACCARGVETHAVGGILIPSGLGVSTCGNQRMGKSRKRGLFIVIEGVDCSGKTAQARRLVAALRRSRPSRARHRREPPPALG